jgi:hypothetical protein
MFLHLLGCCFLLCFEEVAFSPISLRFSLYFLNRCLSLLLDLLSLLLSQDCLSVADLLVLLSRNLVEFAGALVACLAHFLSHNLTERTVASIEIKHAFGGFGRVSFSLLRVVG